MHLRIVILAVRIALFDFPQKDLRAVMLDIGLVHQILVHAILAACRVEDVFLDFCVDGEFKANLLRELLFPAAGFGLLELGEQPLDVPVIGFQKCNCVLRAWRSHDVPRCC